jgi:xanthine dehydrogenase YagR molybdenum-binding subunit
MDRPADRLRRGASHAGAALWLVADVEKPSAPFGSPGLSEEDASKASPRAKDLPQEGNADTAIAAAEVVLEADYGTPTQHHNPIELFTTTAVWRDGENDVHLLRRKAELIP